MKQAVVLFFLAAAVAACAETKPVEQDVIATSLSASVQLFAEREAGVRRAGSGVVLGRDDEDRSIIVTAAHLIEPPQEQTVTLRDPASGDISEAEILIVDTQRDVALLRATSALDVRSASLRAHGRLGDSVWVVSFPWGRRVTVVGGAISQIHLNNDHQGVPIEGPVSLIDASVAYGTSGGGVFDSSSGSLLGVVRGYRTAKVPLSTAEKGSLEVPIAGETTVTPARDVACLLHLAKLAPLQPALSPIMAEACSTPQNAKR